MSAGYRDLLRQHFSEILEELAFMFTDEPEEEPSEPDGPCVRATMRFTGPFEGELCIAVVEEMCPELAANVLGLEPDDALVTANPYDALKELLNVTCGNMLTAIAGEQPVFDLSIPEVSPIGEEDWVALRDLPDTVQLLVDERPVLLNLRTNQ